MSEAGPSKAQKNKSYKWQHRSEGRGGGRGGRGGGRGGFRGGRGGGGGFRPGGGQGDGDNSEAKSQHLGRYRDDPIAEMLSAPGLLVTAIQKKERSAERELIEHLERIADELYPETVAVPVKEEADEELDIEDVLKKELAGMNASGGKSTRFRLCQHEVACVFYIITLAPLDPVRLVLHLLEQVEKTARCPLRYVKRIIPIEAVCGATLTQLKEASLPVVEKGFATPDDTPLRYACVSSSRHSDKIARLDAINAIAQNVESLGKGHKVDLNNADRTIAIEMWKNSVGVGVVTDYERFKKYNVSSVAEAAAKAKHAAKSSTTGQTEKPEEVEKPKKERPKGSNKPAEEETLNLPTKRKAEDDGEVGEDGQIPPKDDVESGELVEGNVDLGEDFEEVLDNGKSVKQRRTE